MENKPLWKAGLAFACYLILAAGIFIGSLLMGIALLIAGINIINPPFPIALVSLPVTESLILGITLLFARSKGAGLRDLGLKKINLKILAIVLVVSAILFLLASAISIFEQAIFGPDPLGKTLEESVTPKNFVQLIAMIAFSLFLVGPCEELAFRGFVQRGFQNSFGKRIGLLIASILFGLLHGLNTLYAIIPISAISLVMGYVWQRTDGNTTASALLHGIYNSIIIAIAYFAAV